MKCRYLLGALAGAAIVASTPSWAQKKYDSGASDTEIKLGETMPYSGPAAVFGAGGRTVSGYFKMLNETKGGINGRKINLLSLDDAYSPPRTVEVTRRLVESDEVLAMVNSAGTGPQTAVQKYLNSKKMPQVFIMASSPMLHDAKNSPWTVPWFFAYSVEGGIYGKYLLQNQPNAKIAVLYQNDDLGKSFLQGLKDALGSKANQIVKEVSFEVTDPTIDSQILQLQASGADTLMLFAVPKPTAQALRKVASIGWKPTTFVVQISSSIPGTLNAAGLENAVGVVSSAYYKAPSDERWANDNATKNYVEFMKKYVPNDNPDDPIVTLGYMGAQLTALVLQRAGDNLTRENLLKEIHKLKDVEVDMLLPGVKINYSADNYYPINQAQLVKFDGKKWMPMSELIAVTP